MTAHVILNPAARGGRNRVSGPAIHSALADAGVGVQIHETRAPGDAERLASSLGQKGHLVVAAGGDGTIHEVVNGLAGTGGTLGVLALGTGNDFAAALGVASSLPEAARQLATARPRLVDLGKATWTESAGSRPSRWFANCFGAGFDAHAAALAAETKWLGGKAAYLAAVFRTLWAWRTPPLWVRVQERVLATDTPAVESAAPLAYDGPLFLMEVGNGHSVGGGFLLTPDAMLDDGQLDVCLVRYVKPGRALRLLPRTFSGAHVGAPEVTMGRIDALSVVAERGAIALQADGETLTYDALDVEIETVPQALRVRAPLA
ncbi:MAG: diacylglycerol kinase family protein [Bacteroidota bacterium]